MASGTGKYLTIGDDKLLLADKLSPLMPYNPKKKLNEITSTGLSAVRLDGTEANPPELGALLEMDVTKRLLDYKQEEMRQPLTAVRSEKGKDVQSNSIIAELDVSLFSKNLDYILRCQVKHRSASAGKTELFDFIGSALMMTNSMVDPDGVLEPGEIKDFNSVRKADLYFIASAGNPFENGFSISPRARFYIDVLFKETINDKRKHSMLPKNWKIEWLNDQRLQLRYWGRMKGRRLVGDPEIFLLDAGKDRHAYIDMRRETRTIEEILQDRHNLEPAPAAVSDNLSWYAGGMLSDEAYRKVQRRWAVAEYSQIMGLMDIVDDLLIRASVNDRRGIDKPLFEERLGRVDEALSDMEHGKYTSLPMIVRLLSDAVPSLYLSRQLPEESKKKQITESELDRMAREVYQMVELIQGRFDRRAIERGLMPYADDKLRFRVIAGESFAYGPAGLYIRR